ncbi:phosphomannomutase/phosphoglucomutase, partial [Crocosphaera sp. Alani8]
LSPNFRRVPPDFLRSFQFATNQDDWQIVPNNYEGVRIACQAGDESGWILLRLSLHDPVIPINIESNVSGGVKKMANKIVEFLKDFDALDLEAFS